MEREDIRKIIKTKFPGDGEKLVYCVHCMNPFLGSASLENEHLSHKGFGTASDVELRTRELMYRALPGLFGDAEAISSQPHECGQCQRWKNGGDPRPGTTDSVFENGTTAICCPHCLMPIHRGEGPYTPEGCRAELLRRATGGAFSIEQDLFEGETKEPRAGLHLHIEPPVMAGVWR